jgi:hypothetical protein
MCLNFYFPGFQNCRLFSPTCRTDAIAEQSPPKPAGSGLSEPGISDYSFFNEMVEMQCNIPE